MLKDNTTYFSLSDVINNAISKSLHLTRSEQGSLSNQIINDMTYSNIWNAFVRWCVDQTEMGNLLNIFPFGSMFYVSEKQFEGISIKVSEPYLRDYDLKWDETKFNFDKHSDSKLLASRATIQKLNLLALANELNLRKNYVQTGLNSLFKSIGVLLSTHSSCLIDLGFLGNVYANGKVVHHVPTKMKKDSQFNKKTTIKALMAKYWEVNDDKKNWKEANDESAYEEHQRKESSTNNVVTNVANSQKYKQSEDTEKREFTGVNYAGSSTSFLHKMKQSMQREEHKLFDGSFEHAHSAHHYAQFDNFSSNDINYPSPIRKINKKNNKVLLVPLKGQWQLKEMINTSFKKGEKSQGLKSVPVLFNDYSNTKGAPFTSEKTQIPIAHRIGSFYSLPLQNFVIDKTNKSIRKLHDEYFYKYKNAVFEMPATEEEDYLSLIGLYSDMKKVELRRSTYKLYKSFSTVYSIPDSCVSEMKESLLVGIVKMCLRAYNLNDHRQYAELLNSLIKEIVVDYKDAMRLSILDYLLKHPELREKLGIPMTFRRLPEYSEASVQRPSDSNLEWKRTWNISKLRISNNLMIMCENITKVLKYYLKQIQSKSYFDLNLKESTACLKLTSFVENQKSTIETHKLFVSEEWRKYVEGVLKENKIYKDQLILYFKSVSALMSSQLRKSIINSLTQYYKFILNFKKGGKINELVSPYASPKTVFNEQFNPSFPFEKSFIELEICASPDGSSFCFSDELSEVHNKLVSLVNELVKCSQDIERPDNMFIKNLDKRSNLWEVSINDVEVTSMLTEIDTTVKENLDVINKVIDLYEPFLFVLCEKSSLDAFRLSLPKREDIRKRIKFYEDKLTILREDMPDSLYMNMFKIDCSNINKTLREMLYDFIVELLEHVRVKNINLKSKELCENIEKLKGDLSQHAQDEQQLFDLDNNLDEYKRNVIPNYYNEYFDFLEWLFFYLEYDTYPIFPEAGKELAGGMDIQTYTKNIYSSVRLISNSLEEFESNLKSKRTTLESNLNRTKTRVNTLITDLRKALDAKKADALNGLNSEDLSYLDSLKNLRKEADKAAAELKSLAKKELLLTGFATEDERIDQCLAELDPIINYIIFFNDFKAIISDYDLWEIRKVNFQAYNAFIEKSNDVFDFVIKMPNIKRHVTNNKDRFENFKVAVELAKYIHSIIDILKFEALQDDNIALYEDNGYFCRELLRIVFPEKDPNKAQDYLKTAKFKEIVLNSNMLKNYKSSFKIEIEKLVGEWENVKLMYDMLERIASEVDVELKTESFKDKKYLIVSSDSFALVKTLLARSIKEIESSTSNVENSKDKVNIMKKTDEYRMKLISLRDLIDKLQDAQVLLEKHMVNSNVLQKKSGEMFSKLKQAEKDYKLLVDFIVSHPKINSVLTVKDIFRDSINSIEKLLNEIPISIYEDNE